MHRYILRAIVSRVSLHEQRDQEEEPRAACLFFHRYGTDTFFHVQGRTDGNHYLEARAHGNSSARSREDISSLLPRIPLFDKRNVERVRR